ncbi:MAG: MaoC family dehydratase N-terminal domain-containing protein [Deltaproteobacteria bacterium]|nr:MaoC family dehydratase N-terminal domain-containing protein [Deltaproteobacteria bacterium]
MALDFDRSILGTEFDHSVHPAVRQTDIDAYAATVGETVAAPGLAPPTYVVSLRTRHFLPPNMPNLGQVGFDAGKDIDFGVPIRVGDTLTSSSTIHDIYEKTGRSGSMRFIVLRTVVTNQRSEQVAVIDQKMMFR